MNPLETPLRFGRHLAVWFVWHTAGVSLVRDQPPPTLDA